ncbi:MAG: ISL3 family transposase [Chloroflexota bacterium]|nr:ISL3 family transposase [Chloroflexota bacterium]MDQ5851925.1 ISL3 family transposase [Chloroflexota bacterium]
MEPSGHVHSRYMRTLADLPVGKQRVMLHLHVRRFFCRNAACARHIFCERLPSVAPAYRRQTNGLYHALQQIGLALGGKPGARLATTLQMPTSWMTVLRRVRMLASPTSVTPRVLGVDDWSWCKGRRYGTILVDLEQHRPVDVLPDRTAASLAAWLTAHPGVEIISRDRGGAYADGARQGAPQALQVADRFHLVKNIGDCLEHLLHRKHADLRRAAQAAATPGASSTPDVTTLPAPTGGRGQRQAQPVVPTRRQQRYADIQQLHAQGMSIHGIARTLHLARNTVRSSLRADECPPAVPPVRASLLTPYEPYLWQRWQAGCHNAIQLWHEIKPQGFRGGISIVKDRVAPWRTQSALRRMQRWSPRHTMWLLRQPATALQPQETAYIAALVTRCPDIAQAQRLTREFIAMVHARDSAALVEWLHRADASAIREFQGFAGGIRRDYTAVEAALTLEWNNGVVEGHVNRLKLLKRQGYGRASLDLLRQRVLHTP